MGKLGKVTKFKVTFAFLKSHWFPTTQVGQHTFNWLPLKANQEFFLISYNQVGNHFDYLMQKLMGKIPNTKHRQCTVKEVVIAPA